MKKAFLIVVGALFAGAISVSTISCSGNKADKTPVADSLLIGEWVVDGEVAAEKVTLKLDTARHEAHLHFAHDNSVEGARYDNYLRGEWAIQGADSLKLDFSEGHGNSSWSGWQTDEGRDQLEKMANEGQEKVKKENCKVWYITDLKVSGDSLSGKADVNGKQVDILYVRDK